jgi:hypothetical protein
MIEHSRVVSAWGTPRAHDIAWRQAVELRQAGLYDSYAESLYRLQRRLSEVDTRFENQGYRKLGELSVAALLDSDFPLLAVGFDRDGLFARHRTIFQLGMAKADPATGAAITGSVLWPVAEGENRQFQALDTSFTEAQVAVLYDKASELQSRHLYVHLPSEKA